MYLNTRSARPSRAFNAKMQPEFARGKILVARGGAPARRAGLDGERGPVARPARGRVLDRERRSGGAAGAPGPGGRRGVGKRCGRSVRPAFDGAAYGR